MPIEHTPNNLYAGYAVKFDAMPYVRFAEQIKARNEAKDMAIDQYFQKLPLGINSAGMRVQDVPGFVEMTNETRNHWMENKEAIKNPRLDNGKAQTEYYQRIENDKLYANNSKMEEEKKKPIVGMMADPNKRGRIRPRMFDAIHAHDLPLNDKNRKSLDFTQDWFSPKPYDPVKYFKSFTEKPTEIVDTRPDPKNPLKKIQTTKYTFTPQDIKSIERKAVDLYRNDDAFGEYVDTELSKPSEYMALNDQFKKYIGRDIDPDKLEEVAIAYTLTGKQLEYEKEKLITDNDAAMRRQQAFQERMTKWRAAHGVNATNPANTPTVDFYSGLYELAMKNPNGVNLSAASGTPQQIIISMLKEITGRDKINQTEVSLKVGQDGNLGVYYRDNVVPISAFDINIPGTAILNKSASGKEETKALEKVNRNTDPKVQQPQKNSSGVKWKK